MRVKISNDFSERVAKTYASKTTVNLEAQSTMDVDKFWESMQIISMNRRALINYRVR